MNGMKNQSDWFDWRRAPCWQQSIERFTRPEILSRPPHLRRSPASAFGGYACGMPASFAPVATRLHPPAPLRDNIAADFLLDPSIAFLNHGSFGARPRVVLDAQDRRRSEFEARPIEWLDRRRNDMIARAKEAVAPVLGTSAQNMGFVTNATGGINAVLRSLQFRAGDELLTTNHVYNAVRKTMQYLAHTAGAKYIEIDIPLPLKSDDQIVAAIEAALTPRTRVLLIDHITSPTAIIFPVQRIVEICNKRGVDVIIDGAHAPGMVRLNVEEIGAAYYSGNLHKWLCAPVGAGFLWVRPDRQKGIHPTIISHFLDESFVNEFNWQGTRDITPWLCVEDSIAYLNGLGLDRVMKHNHQMATWVQAMLCERWNVQPATPLDGSMLGSMATVQLPHQDGLRKAFNDFLALREALYQKHRIEAPIVEWSGRWWVRPCCQVYNSPNQYEMLADAIIDLTQEGRRT